MILGGAVTRRFVPDNICKRSGIGKQKPKVEGGIEEKYSKIK